MGIEGSSAAACAITRVIERVIEAAIAPAPCNKRRRRIGV
jgi:hypothetical protein